MYRNPEPYVPRTRAEIWDLLGRMALGSPTFVDKTGFFAERSIRTEFFALNEGLKSIRTELGKEEYERLVELSDRMRAHFEADPDDSNGESSKGRKCIQEMESILLRSGKRRR